jgi:DNA-binding response OmpR family regulator
MAFPGRIFTRDELINHLYPAGEALVIDRVIDVHIGKLRQKIEDNPSAPHYILTARGMGYHFAEDGG